MITIATAAALLASYDCQLDSPRALMLDGPSVTASELGLPADTMQFSVEIEEGDPITANVKWPKDPMQIGGRFPTIETAPGAYAFSAYSSGPCLLTEKSCISQVSLVEIEKDIARVVITPVALTKNEAAGTRSPFAVIAIGQCRKSEPKS